MRIVLNPRFNAAFQNVPVYSPSDKKTVRNLHSWAPSSCPFAAWSVHYFGLLQNKFPGVFIHSYFSPACNTHFPRIIFKFVRSSLHGFATDVFPSGIFLKTLSSQFFLLAFFPYVLTFAIFLF